MRMTLLLAGTLGLLAVVAGTVGAHVLEGQPPDAMRVFEIGQRYHMFHALAILGCGWLFRSPLNGPRRRLPLAAITCFALGVVLFSGSLYALALTRQEAWGVVTPFGGTLFLVGWALLILAAFTRPDHEA